MALEMLEFIDSRLFASRVAWNGPVPEYQVLVRRRVDALDMPFFDPCGDSWFGPLSRDHRLHLLGNLAWCGELSGSKGRPTSAKVLTRYSFFGAHFRAQVGRR
jgi:hypothetical protein